MKTITVFCGSSTGRDPIYASEAYRLGKILARKNIHLVYGGAQVGLMGAVADGALSEGGKVTGVIPRFLGSGEIAHAGLTELLFVETMHERKQRMYEISDGFIALPGGLGTMEEFWEMCTWAQLGLHRKPIGLLNVLGFYDHLVALLKHMVEQGLLKEDNRRLILVSSDIEDLLGQMETAASRNQYPAGPGDVPQAPLQFRSGS
jgi:uncharacterized protein (TIGR00730 family)